jgi:hypothetical protein
MSAYCGVLKVFSQRYPWLHRILNHEDELFAWVLLLLNLESITNSSATFSEALYGLRRVSASTPLAEQPSIRGASRHQLTPAQKWSSLITSVSGKRRHLAVLKPDPANFLTHIYQ